MVKADKNLSDIEGTIEALMPDRSRPGWLLMTVVVEQAAAVEGFRNMFASAIGSRVDVAVREQDAAHAQLAIGRRMRARVRLERPGVAIARGAGLPYISPISRVD